MFVNFSVSYYLYFTHLNTFFFPHSLEETHGTNHLSTPDLAERNLGTFCKDKFKCHRTHSFIRLRNLDNMPTSHYWTPDSITEPLGNKADASATSHPDVFHLISYGISKTVTSGRTVPELATVITLRSSATRVYNTH